VTLAGLKNLSGVVWASDGQGWYVSVYAAPGGLLTYVDRHGKITNLLDSRAPTYAVPSPDGRHIAFPDWNAASNAWLLQGM
jgi:eukaryotic-like serine/threonine-protein kinase